jgi:hypothetical protein
MNTKIESTTTKELNLESEDRSQVARRGHRLLTMMAISFVFLALCLMFVDFRRLDHLAPRHQTHTLHQRGLVGQALPPANSLLSSRFHGPHHS